MCSSKLLIASSSFMMTNPDPLSLLGEKVFHVQRLRVPKLPRKTLLFMLLLLCGDIEFCPGPNIQNDLQELSNMRRIKLIHQNIRGLFGKREILQILFASDKSKFIITLSKTHKASTNLELFKMPGFQFIHKD